MQNQINRWAVIVNPSAGQGAFQKIEKQFAQALEKNKVQYQLFLTKEKDEAIELVGNLIARGFRNIIAVGGDGTNNEVVNGIMQQDHCPSDEVIYALFPVGTGNDWARQYQIPHKLSDWLANILKGETIFQDVGLVEYTKDKTSKKRFFVNVAGMSYDAFVLDEMNKLKNPMKNRLAYLIYGLYYIFKFKIPKARIRFEDKIIEDFCYLVNAGICKYSGGGMQLVPHAIPDDGKLALTIVGKLSKLGVVLNTHRFYNGKISEHSKVEVFQTDELIVEAENEPILIEVDGEVLGHTPVKINIVPKALQMICF